MKLQEDNIGENIDDLEFAIDFFGYSTKSMIHEKKLVRLTSLRLKFLAL